MSPYMRPALLEEKKSHQCDLKQIVFYAGVFWRISETNDRLVPSDSHRALPIIRLCPISWVNMITCPKSLHCVCLAAEISQQMLVSPPIITEQTTKSTKCANYLQNWLSRGYWFRGIHGFVVFLTDTVLVWLMVWPHVLIYFHNFDFFSSYWVQLMSPRI